MGDQDRTQKFQTSASLPTPSLSASKNKLQGCMQHYFGRTKRDSEGSPLPKLYQVLAAGA